MVSFKQYYSLRTRTLTAVYLLACIAASGCESTLRQSARPNAERRSHRQASDNILEGLSKAPQYPLRCEASIPDNVLLESGMVFGSVGVRDLTADILNPKETPLIPRPALVSLHGGSWRAGKPSQFHFHSAYFASKYGFFAMCVDYRLSGEAKFPAALQDAKCAIRWIRAHALELNIDPNRIAVIGGSAGAHLASMVATTAGVKEYEGSGGNEGFSSQANLAILFNGEFDMWDLVKKGSLLDAMKLFMGGTPEEVPAKYDELSSVKRIHAGVPPVLLLHGTKDGCVSHQQSVDFCNRLKECGGHAEIELCEGKPHAWFNREPDRTAMLKRIEQFLVSQFNL